MEIGFPFFLIIMILICEIVEYDKSKYHLIIIFSGLVTFLVLIDTIIDFDAVYAYPVLFGTLLLTGNRIRVVASYHGHDPDEDL